MLSKYVATFAAEHDWCTVFFIHARLYIHTHRFVCGYFWILAVFSEVNLGKCTSLYSTRFLACFGNRFKAVWVARNNLEQDECRKVRSDYVQLDFFYL